MPLPELQLFLSEYVTSGAWPQEIELPQSLVQEGRAMLETVARDVLEIPHTRLTLTWDSRQRLPNLGVDWRHPEFTPAAVSMQSTCGRVQIYLASTPGIEQSLFNTLSEQTPQVLIIAPEFDAILTQRLQIASQWGEEKLWNARVEAARLCADKYELGVQLQAAGIPVVPGVRLDQDVPPGWQNLLLKPRFGAGSQGIQRLQRPALVDVQDRLQATGATADWLLQPFIQGRNLSVAAIFDAQSQLQHVWPLAAQHLSVDDTFQYLGGSIPAQDVDQRAVEDFIKRVAASIQGLRGYIGFDLLLTEEKQFVLVEINPRLTTSYVGYRKLAGCSLAPWLIPQRLPPQRPPFVGNVTFTPTDTR